MLWFILSLSSAITATLLDVLAKRLSNKISPLKIAQGKVFLGTLFVILYFLILKKNFLDTRNLLLLSSIIPLEVLALYLYLKAISFWPLSHTIPLLSLTPLPLFLTSKIFLNDKFSNSGIIGTILIVSGSYILNISQFKEGFLEPFKALFKEKGSRLMLIVALIYSFNSAIGKRCIEISSVDSFILNYFILLSLGFIIFSILKKEFFSLKEARALIPLGFFSFFLSVIQFSAYSLAPVVYVIAIKRTSILFSVLSGKIFFKEKKIIEKIFGSLLMFSGSVLLGLFN